MYHIIIHFSYGGKKIGKVLTWQDINIEFGTDAEHILLLVDLLLTIPAHSAECERGFSLLKTIKTDWRNKLTDEAVTDLMRITLESADIKSFNPDPAIHAWNNCSTTGRRPNQRRWRKRRQEVAVTDKHECLSNEGESNGETSESEMSDLESNTVSAIESETSDNIYVSDTDKQVDFIDFNDRDTNIITEFFNSDSEESEFDGFVI